MSPLQLLLTDEFLTAALPASTAEGLRKVLSGRPEVLDLRRALCSSELVPAQVEEFVSRVLTGLKPGEKLSEDPALAGVAVALECLPGAFAQRYLDDLSGVRIQEMPLAPRVARVSLARRRKVLVASTDRRFVLSAETPLSPSSFRQVEPFSIDAGLDDHPYKVAS